MTPTPTIDTLPRRRGVALREDGTISDSYGKLYVRVKGGLRRVRK